ncbi:MAG TPA: response regulator [Polyangia bacterium]|nr:response regulator [Polyangia bacterium]
MATPPQSSARIARDPESATLLIMVVEDDTDIRETVAELLVEEGYRVTTATSGRDALEHLTAAPTLPDLVLLDLMMPIMDGWTFYDHLQKEARLATLPIVVISADANVHEKAARLKPLACLRKPVGIDELLSVVARFRKA